MRLENIVKNAENLKKMFEELFKHLVIGNDKEFWFGLMEFFQLPLIIAALVLLCCLMNGFFKNSSKTIISLIVLLLIAAGTLIYLTVDNNKFNSEKIKVINEDVNYITIDQKCVGNYNTVAEEVSNNMDNIFLKCIRAFKDTEENKDKNKNNISKEIIMIKSKNKTCYIKSMFYRLEIDIKEIGLDNGCFEEKLGNEVANKIRELK
jgi:hypothetical protein